MSKYQCSPGAYKLWGELVSAFRNADPFIRGYNPSSSPPASGTHSDLATRSRILRIACAGALGRLEWEGGIKEVCARLTGRRLRRQRVWDVCQRYGLDDKQAKHLGECAKEWLGWALGDEPMDDEPEIPWPQCVRSASTPS